MIQPVAWHQAPRVRQLYFADHFRKIIEVVTKHAKKKVPLGENFPRSNHSGRPAKSSSSNLVGTVAKLSLEDSLDVRFEQECPCP